MKNMMDLQKMLKSAKEMQDRLQKELAALRVEGSSGGGMVTVVLDGHKALQSIRLDPEVVSRDDVEMLQDLIVAAFNDGAAKVDEQGLVLDDVERRLIAEAMERASGNQSKAARLLGVSRDTLRYRLKKHGMA